VFERRDSMAFLEVKGIEKSFGTVKVLKRLIFHWKKER